MLLNWWWLLVVESVLVVKVCFYRYGLGCFNSAGLFRWCLGFGHSGWACN